MSRGSHKRQPQLSQREKQLKKPKCAGEERARASCPNCEGSSNGTELAPRETNPNSMPRPSSHLTTFRLLLAHSILSVLPLTNLVALLFTRSFESIIFWSQLSRKFSAHSSFSLRECEVFLHCGVFLVLQSSSLCNSVKSGSIVLSGTSSQILHLDELCHGF